MSAQRGNPEDEDLIAEAIASALLNVWVAGIGIVQSYDATKKTCSVQPAINRPIETEEGDLVQETPSIVSNVIVAHWGAASFSSHFGLAKGDTVLLVYLDYSPALWRKRGQVSDTPDTHKNGSSYPVAIPFYRPSGGASADTGEGFGIPGGLRMFFEPTFIRVGAGSDFVAMAAKVNARLDALEEHAANHGHPVSTTGSATAQTGATTGTTPAFTPGGGDVSSGNLKAV